MKRFDFFTRQNCARWIFILGVLAGLFFSGGEGVHLLPFPIAEGDNSKNTPFVLEKNFKSYAFSVHNSGNHSTLHKSEFQKRANQYLAAGNSSFGWSKIHANFCFQSAHYREDINLLPDSVVSSSQSDRAPPTI